MVRDDSGDLDRAIRAKDSLKKTLGRPPWLTAGIGVGADDSGYYVKLGISLDARIPPGAVPDRVDGVRVIVEAVGHVRAL